jgi:hypothetical protein
MCAKYLLGRWFGGLGVGRSVRRLRRRRRRAAVLEGRLLAVQGQAACEEDDVRVTTALWGLLAVWW